MDHAIRLGESVVLACGDVARLNSFILYCQPSQPDILCIGQLKEIIGCINLKDGIGSPLRSAGLLIQPFTIIQAEVLPYRFPSIQPDSTQSCLLIKASHCVASVSTIHNCATHQCSISDTRPLSIERCQSKRQMRVLNHVNPDDILLNLAQMRSVRYIQTFQPTTRYPNLPLHELICQATANRRHLQAEAGHQTSASKLVKSLKRPAPPSATQAKRRKIAHPSGKQTDRDVPTSTPRRLDTHCSIAMSEDLEPHILPVSYGNASPPSSLTVHTATLQKPASKLEQNLPANANISHSSTAPPRTYDDFFLSLRTRNASSNQ